jgi:hypothetical protein
MAAIIAILAYYSFIDIIYSAASVEAIRNRSLGLA